MNREVKSLLVARKIDWYLVSKQIERYFMTSKKYSKSFNNDIVPYLIKNMDR